MTSFLIMIYLKYIIIVVKSHCFLEIEFAFLKSRLFWADIVGLFRKIFLDD